MVAMTINIDGEQIQATTIISDDEGFWSAITGLQLHGSKDYNGHLHGTTGDFRVCLPNVVDSLALRGDGRCDRLPVEADPYIWAVYR